MEWKKYPENKPNVSRQGFFLVKGRSANTNGLSSQYMLMKIVCWDGHEFGHDIKTESPLVNGWWFQSVDMIVEEYLQID
jgi:hypothetical protein